MNRWKSTLLAAMFAGASMSGAAWAQDQPSKPKAQSSKADATPVVPAREDLQPGAAPTAQRMDDNTQRAHDRDRDGAKKGTGSASAKGVTADTAGTGATPTAAAGTRDWDKIDANNDNLIQPDEMESWLKQVGPQAKPKQ